MATVGRGMLARRRPPGGSVPAQSTVTAPREPPPERPPPTATAPPRERVIHVDFERGRRHRPGPPPCARHRAPGRPAHGRPGRGPRPSRAPSPAPRWPSSSPCPRAACAPGSASAWSCPRATQLRPGPPGTASPTSWPYAAKGLAASGFSTAGLRAATDALRAELPDLAQPLTDARLGADGRRLVARKDGARFDATTGQLVFDFDVRALRDDVVRVLRPRVSQRQQEAWRWYLEGLRLDEDETARGRAEEAYRKAIALDPKPGLALTNLGNLRLTDDDTAEAEALYRRAMAADPALAEAPYNLAYLLVERGEREAAIALFERAITLRPDFAEAHYNLAMALTEIGDSARARPHWRRYLELDPPARGAPSPDSASAPPRRRIVQPLDEVRRHRGAQSTVMLLLTFFGTWGAHRGRGIRGGRGTASCARSSSARAAGAPRCW